MHHENLGALVVVRSRQVAVRHKGEPLAVIADRDEQHPFFEARQLLPHAARRVPTEDLPAMSGIRPVLVRGGHRIDDAARAINRHAREVLDDDVLDLPNDLRLGGGPGHTDPEKARPHGAAELRSGR